MSNIITGGNLPPEMTPKIIKKLGNGGAGFEDIDFTSDSVNKAPFVSFKAGGSNYGACGTADDQNYLRVVAGHIDGTSGASVIAQCQSIAVLPDGQNLFDGTYSYIFSLDSGTTPDQTLVSFNLGRNFVRTGVQSTFDGQYFSHTHSQGFDGAPITKESSITITVYDGVAPSTNVLFQDSLSLRLVVT